MKKIHIFLLVFLWSFISKGQESIAVNELQQEVVWSFDTLSDASLHEGLAGTYSGRQGSWLLVAGGSYFPYKKPWQGGQKYFSDAIFVFQIQKDDSLKLMLQGKLPQAIAEGAYTMIDKGLLCIGGQTQQEVSKAVMLVSYHKDQLLIESYPELPVAVKMASSVTIGKYVYVLGGQLQDGTSIHQFIRLDTQRLDKGWEVLPQYPMPISGASMVSQQDGKENSIFVFGGRNKTSGEITQFYSDVYTYKPNQKIWVKKQSITSNGEELALSVATALKVGASSIALIGGDTGHIFNKVEKAILEDNLSVRDSLWIHHTGFHKDILVYNTISDSWFVAGQTDTPVAVASGISDGKQLWVIAGERKAGVRAPNITLFSFTKESNFGWINYLVLILYFIGMLWIGFFFMKNNNNTDDYFKASGRIPWWAAGISIFATMLSSITFISIPAKTYATDWRMFFFNMTTILAVPFVIRYFLPFFLRFKFDTAYQYLEVRFSRPIRWIASGLFTLFMISRIAVVLFLPSLALNAVTGFDVYYAILIMGIVTIIYSTSGGMEAVVWGDVVQGFVLIGGAIAAFVFMIGGIQGGISTFWDVAINYQKFEVLDLRLDWQQPVFWVVIFGGLANTLISYTSDQSVIQRYMSTINEKATAKSIWLNGIISIPVSILFFVLGTGLFVFYKYNPESMVVSNANIDAIFPQFIVSEMPIGFAGLLIASIFAAAMSTLSSNINSVSAVVTSDFYKTWFQNTSFRQDMLVARISGIIVGVLGIVMAIVLARWDIASLWDQFNTFLGLLTSGLGALFVLGIFFPRVNSVSALIGLIGGITLLYIVKENTTLSFLLYGLVGVSSSIILAVLCSFIFPNKKEIKGYTWKSRCSK